MVEQKVGSVMVVRGGIAGMQTAWDLGKRFFSNAGWWQLNPLTYNVLSVIKRKGFPRLWLPAPYAMSTWMPARSRSKRSSRRALTFPSSTSPN